MWCLSSSWSPTHTSRATWTGEPSLPGFRVWGLAGTLCAGAAGSAKWCGTVQAGSRAEMLGIGYYQLLAMFTVNTPSIRLWRAIRQPTRLS